MGLMGTPRLIIADEPTTALDVTVQREVLRVLRDVVCDRGAGALFISHNLAVVRYVCDDIAVMRHGRLLEAGPVQEVLTAPGHPCTRTLLDAVPSLAHA
ncbi:hypothetical protein DEJ48_37955 [Streptomyces venezuelae]|uniref:ABC transporter ATP-binding protein n=1 Tax=Streptomyces venezuelae TaxID=54571 RepID=A0A5P2CAP8_STRVZ|nr:hypothetical protein [Streptomyces venezuelae]QES38441.1 hypothetical protein DEJ48_37955 [Streptomyces venezuelae]